MKSAIKTQSKSTAFILAATVVALACAASAGRALADQPGEALSKKVTYGDLDLESQQGAKALYARLRFAAREVCVPFESIELSRQRVWRNCVDNALDSAVAQVNKTRVTALHNQTVNHSTKG
jgi:UrcA family protein